MAIINTWGTISAEIRLPFLLEKLQHRKTSWSLYFKSNLGQKQDSYSNLFWHISSGSNSQKEAKPGFEIWPSNAQVYLDLQ